MPRIRRPSPASLGSMRRSPSRSGGSRPGPTSGQSPASTEGRWQHTRLSGGSDGRAGRSRRPCWSPRACGCATPPWRDAGRPPRKVVSDHHRESIGTSVGGQALGPLAIVAPPGSRRPVGLQDVVCARIARIVGPVGRRGDPMEGQLRHVLRRPAERHGQSVDPGRRLATVLTSLAARRKPVDPDPRVDSRTHGHPLVLDPFETPQRGALTAPSLRAHDDDLVHRSVVDQWQEHQGDHHEVQPTRDRPRPRPTINTGLP